MLNCIIFLVVSKSCFDLHYLPTNYLVSWELRKYRVPRVYSSPLHLKEDSALTITVLSGFIYMSDLYEAKGQLVLVYRPKWHFKRWPVFNTIRSTQWQIYLLTEDVGPRGGFSGSWWLLFFCPLLFTRLFGTVFLGYLFTVFSLNALAMACLILLQ